MNALDLTKKCIHISQEFTNSADDFKPMYTGSSDFHTCLKNLSPTDVQWHLCSSAILALKKIPFNPLQYDPTVYFAQFVTSSKNYPRNFF